MKKNLIEILSWILSAFAITALVAFFFIATSMRPQGSAQVDGIQALEERLLKLGIPVKTVTVTNKSPLEIEIVLHSSGNDGRFSQDDIVNKFLAVREVELAHLNFAILIKSYRLILVAENGNPIYDSTIYLSPDLPSQKVSKVASSSVNVSETKEILEQSIDLHGFDLVTLDIPSSYITSDNSKLVTLNLSTGTTIEKTDASQIDKFFVSLRPQIDAINNSYGTRIVLIHILILDTNGKLLVNYLEDFETGKQSSWVDENIKVGWYPQPAPAVTRMPEETGVPPVVISTATHPEVSLSTPTPALPVSYPPPVTTIPVPYP